MEVVVICSLCYAAVVVIYVAMLQSSINTRNKGIEDLTAGFSTVQTDVEHLKNKVDTVYNEIYNRPGATKLIKEYNSLTKSKDCYAYSPLSNSICLLGTLTRFSPKEFEYKVLCPLREIEFRRKMSEGRIKK